MVMDASNPKSRVGGNPVKTGTLRVGLGRRCLCAPALVRNIDDVGN